MKDWLTLSEVALELRIRPSYAKALFEKGVLQGIKTGPHNNILRIIPPGERLKAFMLEAQREHCVHVPLFTTVEVAAFLGVKKDTIKTYVDRGQLKPAESSSRQAAYFTAAELRRFIWWRERRHRRNRKVYSPQLAAWLKHFLAGEQEQEVQVLDDLNRQLMAYVPESEQALLATAFWKHLDGLNEILKRVRDYRS